MLFPIKSVSNLQKDNAIKGRINYLYETKTSSCRSVSHCLQLSETTVVTLAVVRHASSGSKNQRCECAPFSLENSRRVRALFVILVQLVNLLRGEIFVLVCVRVAYPNIKERRLFSHPEALCTNIQSHVRGLVGAPRQHFACNFLENRLISTSVQYHLEYFSLKISNFVVPLCNVSSTHTNHSMVSVKQVHPDAHHWDVIEFPAVS